MTRLGSLILCATTGAGLLACGSNDATSTKDILDLVPRANTVSGWTIDPGNSKTSGSVAATATSEFAVEALIDGGAADFFVEPNIPTNFAWQNFVNSALPAAPDGAHVKLYILQLPSADKSKGLYKEILQSSRYSRKVGTPEDWQPTTPLVGTDSRIQDTGTQWWINFHKEVFYVEVMLDPSPLQVDPYTPGNPDTKQETLRFAQAIAAKF